MNQDKDRRFVAALRKNDLAEMRSALEDGARPQLFTELFGKLQQNLNRPETIRLCAEFGADLNQKTSSNGWNPLFENLHLRNLSIAEVLLECGANPNLAISGQYLQLDKHTPLLMVCHTHEDPTDAIRLLLKHKADPAASINDSGEGPLHLLARRGDWPDAVQLLIDAGTPMDQTAHSGLTPLLMAAALRRDATVKTLLASGASVQMNAKQENFMQIRSPEYYELFKAVELSRKEKTELGSRATANAPNKAAIKL